MNLAIGTAQFGLNYGISNKKGLISIEEGKKILDFSIQNGIDTIDTAVLYGKSEINLGTIGVDNFKVITKIPNLPNCELDINNWINQIVNNSKKNLNISSIYAVLMHRPSDLLSPYGKEIYESLFELKKSGIIDKIGISSYSCSEIELLIRKFSFDIVQTPLNLIDRNLLESKLLKKLKKQNIEIHVRSIFLQGILLLPRNKIPIQFENWNYLWDKWHDWLNTNNINPVQACLSYVKNVDEIDKVIVGIDSIKHIQKIVEYYNQDFSYEFPNIASKNINLINPSKWQNI